jgi:hypothetical protein
VPAFAAKDRDGDGITDDKDKCPDQPEDRDGYQDLDGCPDPDNDADGVVDADDRCPNEPEDKDGFQDDDGCPDPDNDADGIADPQDKCPNEPENKNGFEDDDGCPDTPPSGGGQGKPPSQQQSKEGLLEITAKPWADVTLDGKPIGRTPIKGFRAAPGKHTIVLTNNAAKRTQTITVDAGKTAKVYVSFDP